MTDALVEFVHEFAALEVGNTATGSLGRPGKKEKKMKKEELRTGLGLEPSYVYKMLLNLSSDTFKVRIGDELRKELGLEPSYFYCIRRCLTSVVDPNPEESESFSWIRIRKKSSDSDPDTVVE
jgi:hypothetical protein